MWWTGSRNSFHPFVEDWIKFRGITRIYPVRLGEAGISITERVSQMFIHCHCGMDESVWLQILVEHVGRWHLHSKLTFIHSFRARSLLMLWENRMSFNLFHQDFLPSRFRLWTWHCARWLPQCLFCVLWNKHVRAHYLATTNDLNCIKIKPALSMKSK